MRHFFSDNLNMVLRTLLIGMLLGTTQVLQAQCPSLECKGSDISAPLTVAVDGECRAILNVDVLIVDPSTCPVDRRLVVRDPSNNIIVEGINEVVFDATAYIDQTLSYTMTDDTALPGSALTCSGFVAIEDNLPPVFDCLGTRIFCTSDTSVASIGQPAVMDNCSNVMNLTYYDIIEEGDCDFPVAYVISRVWTAQDASGNVGTCIQSILVERPDLEELVFPVDVNLDCVDADADPRLTGVPTLEGIPIPDVNFCGVEVTYLDDTTFLCTTIGYQIERIWNITDVQCTSNSRIVSQFIVISDDTPPVMECPGDVVFGSSVGTCTGVVTLPAPAQIFDNCDANPTFVVTTSWGGTGLGPHIGVEVGQHTATYIALDECGNTSECVINVTVEDTETPAAVCEDLTAAVNSAGYAFVFASTIDEGSFDNCQDRLYYKVKRVELAACDGINGDDAPGVDGYQEWFDDMAIFCCDEIDLTPRMVTLRVYDVDPGSGPVDPSREQPGGDLFGRYSDCMSTVTLQDKIPPVMKCAPAITITCKDDLTDLDVYGVPQVADNCSSVTLTSIDILDLDECGTGRITRTFTATDEKGNSSKCVQTINVILDDKLEAADIVWPQNYTTNVCGATVAPEDLPTGFDVPVINYESCGMIAVNYSDKLFNSSPGACYKVMRTWSVMDWCAFNEYKDLNTGLFTHVQMIEVRDNEAPVMNCIPDTVVSLISGCDFARVNLPTVTATDCSQQLSITNNSPYADSKGANASGLYPFGKTTVTFTTTDKCGNVSTCKVVVEVVDRKKPSPSCIVGLSANLVRMGNDNMAIVNARSFNVNSFDNCTPKDQLKFTVRRRDTTQMTAPQDTQLVFTCADVGLQEIEFWATDAYGNSDFCLTRINIQDNMKLCPASSPVVAMVKGAISTEDGRTVENVEVKVQGMPGMEAVTDVRGDFTLSNLRKGASYNIVAQKQDDVMNGISTFDLVLVTKHVLGIQTLDSPYKLIAADIDRSGSITAMDIVYLRSLILNINTELPGGKSSWRFIDANYAFKNPQNPFLDTFPEAIQITEAGLEEFNRSFRAIKIGDVDYTAISNQLMATEARSGGKAWPVEVKNPELRPGVTFKVPVTAGQLTQTSGFQFALQFSTDALKLTDVQPGNLQSFTMDNFGLTDIDRGIIMTSWGAANSGQYVDETVLFTLTFQATQTGRLSDYLRISEREMPAEAYTGQSARPLVLNFTEAMDAGTDKGLYLAQNRPNPFDYRTQIGFELPESGEVSLKVFNLKGQVVYRSVRWLDAGQHEWELYRKDFPQTGLYYYQLESNGLHATKKMIVK